MSDKQIPAGYVLVKQEVPDKKETKEVKLSTALLTSRGKGSKALSLPPKIKVFPPRRLVMRNYVSSAVSSSTAITNRTLLSLYGVIANSTTTAIGIHDIVRVRKLTIWPSGSTSTLGDFNVSWTLPSVTFGNPDVVQDETTPANVTVTKAYVYKPPKGSLASMWITNTNDQPLFYLMGVSAGSVVDVECELTQAIQGTGTVYTSSGLTSGLHYYGSLDGSGAKFKPVSGVPSLW